MRAVRKTLQPRVPPGQIGREHPELRGQLDIPVAEPATLDQHEHEVRARKVGQAPGGPALIHAPPLASASDAA